MTPLSIIPDQASSCRCYFEPFNVVNDYDPKTKKSGLSYYRFAWWGWILSLFGFASSLKSSNGKVYYISKKELEKWIARHKGFKEGNYYERVAEICKKQFVENWKTINKDHVIQTNKRQNEHKKTQRKESTFTINKERKKENSDKSEKNELNKKALIDETIKNDKIQTIEDDDKFEKKLHIEIILGDEKIVANPKRLRKSHYFSHILDDRIKELKKSPSFDKQQKYKIEIEINFDQEITEISHYSGKKPLAFTRNSEKVYLDTSSYRKKTFEIDYETFEMLKIFFEGKNTDIEDEKKLEKLMIPDQIENLYKIHRIFDISGLIEIAYRKIDLYSEKKLLWKGNNVCAFKFWTDLMKDYGDQTLKKLCHEIYQIETMIENHDKEYKKVLCSKDFWAAETASLRCIHDQNGNLEIVMFCQLNYDYVVSNFRKDYYKKHFELFKVLEQHLVNKYKFSKIIIDFSEITAVCIKESNLIYANYLIYFLLQINQHLQFPKNQIDLVINNGDNLFFNNIEEDEKKLFLSILKELLQKYRIVSFVDFTFHQFDINDDVTSFYEKLFRFLSLDNTHLDACFSFSKNDDQYAFSASLQLASDTHQNMTIEYEPSKFSLSQFAWLSNFSSLTLRQLGTTKDSFDPTNLSQLNTSSLIIENALLDSRFVEEYKKFCSKIHLELKECQYAPNCQNDVDIIDDCVAINEAIRKNRESLSSSELLAANHCLPQCELNSDFTMNLIFYFKLDAEYILNWNREHYFKCFSFIYNHLNNTIIYQTQFSHLIIDVKEISQFHQTLEFPKYISYLLNDINDLIYLIDPTKIDFVIRNFSFDFLQKNQTEGTSILVDSIKNLLLNYSTVIFNDCQSSDFTLFSPNLNLIKVDEHTLVFHHDPDPINKLTIQLIKL